MTIIVVIVLATFIGCVALCALALWGVSRAIEPPVDETADTDWWRAVLIHESHYRGVHRG